MVTRLEQAKIELNNKLNLLFHLNDSNEPISNEYIRELKAAIDAVNLAYLELLNAERAKMGTV
jgi:hypothetical protein